MSLPKANSAGASGVSADVVVMDDVSVRTMECQIPRDGDCGTEVVMPETPLILGDPFITICVAVGFAIWLGFVAGVLWKTP